MQRWARAREGLLPGRVNFEGALMRGRDGRVGLTVASFPTPPRSHVAAQARSSF
jgi:hypothetical protein